MIFALTAVQKIMLYYIARLFIPSIFKLLFSLKITGRENIPHRGPAIVAVNHTSYLDPLLVGIAWVPYKLLYLAKKELFSIPVFGWLIKNLGAIPISREAPGVKAFRRIFGALERNQFVLMFPEGTRSWDGKWQTGKPGTGFIVYRAKVPVIPVLIEGAHRALPRGSRRIRFTPISVQIGKPLQFPAFYTKAPGRQTYQAITDKIMSEICSLARDRK